MDITFDKYSAKVHNDKVTDMNSNLLIPDWYTPTNPLDLDSVRELKFGYSGQLLIITVTKGHSKQERYTQRLWVLLCEHNTYLSTYPKSFMSKKVFVTEIIPK